LGECASTGLGNWYANLFRVSRYKCLLFTSEITLFSFFIFRAGKKETSKLSDEFQYYLRIALQQEKIPDKVIYAILQDYINVKYAPTGNRSVLGSMNDIIAHIKFVFENKYDFNPSNVNIINKELNRIPLKANNYVYAIEKLHKLLEFCFTEA